ncbi:hypothetical protein E4M16_14155, partial [Ligilactobacillus ruminis]
AFDKPHDEISTGTEQRAGTASHGVNCSAHASADGTYDTTKSALKAAKSALGIHSPSRVMRDQVGYYTVAGFANGLTGNKD